MEIPGVTVELNPPGSLESQVVLSRHALILNFGYAEAWASAGSDRSRRLTFRPYSLSYLPKGTDLANRNEKTSEFLMLGIDDAFLADWRPDYLDTHADRCVFDCVSPGIADLARSMRRLVIAAPDAADPMAAETMAGDLVAHLGAALLARAAPEAPRTTELDRRRLRHVLDLVEADLAADLSVADLARSVGVSAPHFAHAFKAALGQPPHAFVLERRIARARDLLASSDLPLADIAYAVGFSSQSHMTTAFGKALGVTPGGYRDA